MKNIDLSSNASQTSEQQLDLHGSTLQVYWYILTNPKKAFSYSEIQKVMGFSSKSSAIYQLDKLCELQILRKTGNGYAIVSRPKPRALKPFFLVKFLIIPKAFIYGLILLLINLSVFLLFYNGPDILPFFLASIPNLVATSLFFSEAVLIWKNRPKPPFSNNLKSNIEKIRNRVDLQKNVGLFKQAQTKRTVKARKKHSIKRKMPLLKSTIRFMMFLGIIVLLVGQIVLIGVLLGFDNRNYIAQIEKKTEVTFLEPIPIQIEKTGFFFHKNSFYALCNFKNTTVSGEFLFQINLNENLNAIKDLKSYKIPFGVPNLGRGLTWNGSLFWTIEKWGNQTNPQKLYSFSKDMTFFQNISLPIPSELNSMNLRFNRRDLGFWNDSLWILEAVSNMKNDEIHVNVSQYSLESYQNIKSFIAPFEADALFFDEQGQMWLYEFESYPDNKLNLIAVEPNNGKILKGFRGYTPLEVIPQTNTDFDSLYPLVYKSCIIQPISIDSQNQIYLWGFQIIPYSKKIFPLSVIIFWGLTTTLGLVFSILTIWYWNKIKYL
ncbi:MAG: hypothetical protein ACFFAU_19515 [Candidatus Hodarchaeota archaeon]